MEQTSPVPAGKPGRFSAALRKYAAGLPARLLLLTASLVMAAEIIVFVPNAADFRRNWLMQKLDAAKIASVALEAARETPLPERLRQELLSVAGVRAISATLPGSRHFVLGSPDEIQSARIYDLRSSSFFTLMIGGIEAFAAPPGRVIRVVGSLNSIPDGGEISVTVDETPLRDALWRWAGTIFWQMLLVSLIAVALVYLALTALLIHPMVRITRSMAFYRENPEDTARIIATSNRSDEIGTAEKELAALQTQLTDLLREKARLAKVGLAVSKINHDMRNMLAGAQLVSDRLASVADPTVQRFVPRLIRALDRAIALCANTVAYGSSEEAPPKRAPFALRPLITEVNESLIAEDLSEVKVSVL